MLVLKIIVNIALLAGIVMVFGLGIAQYLEEIKDD